MTQALKNIRRNPYQTLSASLILAVTVFVTGIFALVSLGSHIILQSFETKPQVIAYLIDSHEASDVAALTAQVRQVVGVRDIRYVSKSEALEIYKQSVSNDPLLLGSLNDWSLVTADILPASIEVSVTSRKVYQEVVSVLQTSDIISVSSDGTKEIDFPQDIVSELNKWTDAIRIAGAILIAILISSSLLTVMVIISLKLGNRKEEIKTLKLIGASRGYIIRPYLAESIYYGIFGGVFGAIMTLLAILYTSPYLSPWLSGIVSYPLPHELYIILGSLQVALAIIISFVSALLAGLRFVNKR
jgi:cell division transport system permease protein